MMRAFPQRGGEVTERIAVLMYHDVCAGPGEHYTVGRDRLAHDAVAVRAPGVVDCEITFDDGRLGTFVEGLPVLVEAGLEATLFMITGRIGQAGYMTEGMLRTWCAAGQRVGSHAVTHRALSSMQPSDAAAELRDSKRRLEDLLGRPVDEFAFPGGNLTSQLIAIALETGYRRVHTSRPGFARTGHPVVPRFTIHATTALEAVASLRSGREQSFFRGDQLRSAAKRALGTHWYGVVQQAFAKMRR